MRKHSSVKMVSHNCVSQFLEFIFNVSSWFMCFLFFYYLDLNVWVLFLVSYLSLVVSVPAPAQAHLPDPRFLSQEFIISSSLGSCFIWCPIVSSFIWALSFDNCVSFVTLKFFCCHRSFLVYIINWFCCLYLQAVMGLSALLVPLSPNMIAS